MALIIDFAALIFWVFGWGFFAPVYLFHVRRVMRQDKQADRIAWAIWLAFGALGLLVRHIVRAAFAKFSDLWND